MRIPLQSTHHTVYLILSTHYTAPTSSAFICSITVMTELFVIFSVEIFFIGTTRRCEKQMRKMSRGGGGGDISLIRYAVLM